MATLIVPPLDEEPWPTLGPQVCDFIEAHGVYGPGDLEGQQYELTTERRAHLYRAYEVYPHGHRLAGRRRFKQVSLEQRKGTAKTEFAMLVVLAESHPEAPVRCDGFRKVGKRYKPVGRPMLRPYIPLVSYTVEQTDDLGYNVLKYIIENCDLVDDYDVSDERILVLDHGKVSGKMVPLAAAPSARDGALTTHQHFDEPHRMTLPRLKNAFNTMKENTYKRVGADAWTHTTSTAGEVGEGSVQEDIRHAAEMALESDDGGRSAGTFFFSRYATDELPLDTDGVTPARVMDFLLEASGGDAAWSGDLDGLVKHYFEAKTDRRFYRRVWGNQWVRGGSLAFDMKAWAEQGGAERSIPAGATVVAGFHGTLARDSTTLVLIDGDTGVRHLVGQWERPANDKGDWSIPREEVDELVRSIVKDYDLWRLYGDPHLWGPWLDEWAGEHGKDRIVHWDTKRPKPFAYACRNLAEAVVNGETPHTADKRLTDHMGHARKVLIPHWDEEDPQNKVQLWRIARESADGRQGISGAIAQVLAHEAHGDWVEAGRPRTRRVVTAHFF